MKQRTCILVKPDGVEKKVIGKVLDRLEGEGFALLAMKLLPPDRGVIERFYSIHRGKSFYPAFIEFMMTGPIVATVWEGDDIIRRSRKVIGATNSKEAEEGTLRFLYGTDNRMNLVHGSDSEASAEREIGILFKKGELCEAGTRIKSGV